MARNQVGLGEVLDVAGSGIRNSLHHVMPGVVAVYTPGVKGKSAPTVDVLPATHDVRIDTETGALVSEPWPIIPGVPVGWPKMGGYAVAAPLKFGDAVLLIAFDLDPSRFRSSGQPSDPIDTRRHGGGYWIALPFDITDPGAITDPGDALVVGQPDGVQVKISAAGVAIGAAAPVDAVALASKVDLFIQTVMGWVTVPNDGGAALLAALTTAGFTSSSSSASATVKVTR